jgi:hypothetical protein
MGKIALYQNTSLDGVMQSPGRRISDARGRRGEHDLCTCHGGRVMRTLGVSFAGAYDQFSDRTGRVPRAVRSC